MAVDLHTHSLFSDGSDTPDELMARSAEAGLRAVALTDHDTAAGLPAAQEAALRLDLELIPGVEISCDWQPGSLHMLVLFLGPGPGPFQERLEELHRWREDRNVRLIERLRGLGIEITLEEVEAEADGNSVGRPHFAAVLVRKGVVPNFSSAFQELLAKGRPAYVERHRLRPDEAIALARASGALPVLAHPHTLGLAPGPMRQALIDLARSGLVGLECYYSDYLPEERLRLAELARLIGLIPTGGSDYHGSYKPWLRIGRGQGDLLVPDAVLEELQMVRGALVT